MYSSNALFLFNLILRAGFSKINRTHWTPCETAVMCTQSLSLSKPTVSSITIYVCKLFVLTNKCLFCTVSSFIVNLNRID